MKYWDILGVNMDFDKDKVDEMTLALMYLTTFFEKIPGGICYRSWKGYDWDTMNRLYEKGLIDNPIGKAKSVSLTNDGRKLSEELFNNPKFGLIIFLVKNEH